MKKIRKLYFLSFLLLIFCLQAKSTEGTVVLTDGSRYTGTIVFGNSPSFWDLFRKRHVKLPQSQIYRIVILEKSVLMSKKKPSFVKKTYIMGITTWEGKRYWGSFNCRVVVHEKYKTHRFSLAKKRNTKASSHHVKEIICKSKLLQAPDKKLLLALGGRIQPAEKFHHVFAVHYEYGTVFSCELSAKRDRYDLPEIMPGGYDLFFVADDIVIFALTPSLRSSLMDEQVRPTSRLFKNWVEHRLFTERKSKKQLLYVSGRNSDARAIVMEEIVTVKKATSIQGYRIFWLCRCSRQGDRWQLKKSDILHRQSLGDAIPMFLLDLRLANIIVPINGGNRNYDCLWE